MAGSEESRTTRSEDADVEAAVLHHLLELHPAPLTTAELIRELAGEQPGFAERDAVERAVRDLAAVGLLHRSAELVLPTRAALRFQALSER
jgi:predicted transcriptional regulator